LLSIPNGSILAPADADGVLVPTVTGLDLRNGLLTGLPWANRADQAVPLKQLTQALNLANTAIEAKIDVAELATAVEAYGYQTAPQVSTSIATAIAAIDFGNRRASVPAKYYYEGTIAQYQALLSAGTISLGVSDADDFDTPEVIASLTLLKDPATGAFTLLQNQTNGLAPVNDLFFLNNGNIGSAFFIRANIAGQAEYAGKAFVVTNANSGTALIEAVMDPDRQMNSAGDAIAISVAGEIDVLVDTAAIVIDGQNRLTLAQSVKDAIAKIPGMETAIAALESAIVRIDGTLSSLQTQVTALAARMLTAEGAIVDLGSRATALEAAKAAIVERLNGLLNPAYEILLEASGPKYRNASDVLVSASAFVTLVSETDNYATYSIAHGLNQKIIPAQYWLSNAAGAMLEQFTAARVTGQTANAYNVTVRKSDSVLVQIPVTPKVLAALTV
jgi:phage gp36-like protein